MAAFMGLMVSAFASSVTDGAVGAMVLGRTDGIVLNGASIIFAFFFVQPFLATFTLGCLKLSRSF